jgi:hypothetical protein
MLADWQTCLIRQLVILHILVNEEKNHWKSFYPTPPLQIIRQTLITLIPIYSAFRLLERTPVISGIFSVLSSSIKNVEDQGTCMQNEM